MLTNSPFNVPFVSKGILCERCLINGSHPHSRQNAEYQFPCNVCQDRKQAVAHCRNCKDSLCPTCLSAHQLTNAFEEHKVHLFQKHKVCHSHTDEALAYYCDNCQSPVCVGCMLTKVGVNEIPPVVEDKVKTEIRTVKRNVSEDFINLMSGPSLIIHQVNILNKGKPYSHFEIPITVNYKIGHYGNVLGQFSCPRGFCLGFEEEIVVADTNNHRIQVFRRNDRYYYSRAFGRPGKDEGCLWYPSKVAFMKKLGNYLVYDGGVELARLQTFSKNGDFIKSINIGFVGNVGGMTLTVDENIVIMDNSVSILNILSENGERLRYFNLRNYLAEPTDIVIHDNRYYVCDYKGHRVVVIDLDGHVVRQFGPETNLYYPNGIAINEADEILVVDSCDKRLQISVYSQDGALVRKYRLSDQYRVNKCNGLRITSEGLVHTLGQNNHQLLVLDPLPAM